MRDILVLILLSISCCGETELKPKPGAWTYNDSMLVMNTCGANTPLKPSTEVTLTFTDPDSFNIADEQFMNAFKCFYNDPVFVCLENFAGSSKPIDSVDATFFYNVKIDGLFDSEHELSGRQDVDVRCEGSGCGLVIPSVVPQLPCAYTHSFTADAA